MIIPNLAQPPNFLFFLRFGLLVFISPLESRAETPPLVKSEPILVPATKGKFDYLQVDEQFHRLLANHTGNGTLDVFDLPDGKLRQAVAIGAAQDVAIDIERSKYYVTVSDRSNLTIVDRQTLKVEGAECHSLVRRMGVRMIQKMGSSTWTTATEKMSGWLIPVHATSSRQSKYPKPRNSFCTIRLRTGFTRI